MDAAAGAEAEAEARLVDEEPHKDSRNPFFSRAFLVASHLKGSSQMKRGASKAAGAV